MSRRSQPVEWVLFAIGVACCAWYLIERAEATRVQRTQLTRLEAALADAVPPEAGAPGERGHRDHAPAGAVGVLEIPRLGLVASVQSGDDDETLRSAIGHLPDTPLPWTSGNTVLAAHRDGLFRPLADIQQGDLVRLRTTRGGFDYRVTEMTVVEPDDLSVLAPTYTQSLTLITCYPFQVIGPAPKRFVVRADRVPSS